MHGLAEIVVGSELEPDHAVDRVAAPGQDHDPGLGRRAHMPGQLQAALVRQAEIDHDQVVAAAGQAPPGAGAVGSALDVESLVAEVLRNNG
jgi:hypothetical protein